MVDMQPIVEIDLPERPAAVPGDSSPVPQVQVAALQPGATVNVKADAQDPSDVWLNLGAAF